MFISVNCKFSKKSQSPSKYLPIVIIQKLFPLTFFRNLTYVFLTLSMILPSKPDRNF